MLKLMATVFSIIHRAATGTSTGCSVIENCARRAGAAYDDERRAQLAEERRARLNSDLYVQTMHISDRVQAMAPQGQDSPIRHDGSDRYAARSL
jgi:hypothetical protein